MRDPTTDNPPCKTCGKPAAFPEARGETQKCTNCWEFETRIDLYLQSEKGRDFVRTKLQPYEAEKD